MNKEFATDLRVLAAVLLSTLILPMATGCGEKTDSQPTTDEAAVHASQDSDEPPIPLPSAAELNAGFLLGLDPTTSKSLRAAAVEGSDLDPDFADKLAQASRANNLQITITDVAYAGNGVANAAADMTVKGKPVAGKVTVPFVAVDGRWKLQRAWSCQMLLNADIQSSACPL